MVDKPGQHGHQQPAQHQGVAPGGVGGQAGVAQAARQQHQQAQQAKRAHHAASGHGEHLFEAVRHAQRVPHRHRGEQADGVAKNRPSTPM